MLASVHRALKSDHTRGKVFLPLGTTVAGLDLGAPVVVVVLVLRTRPLALGFPAVGRFPVAEERRVACGSAAVGMPVGLPFRTWSARGLAG